MRVFLFSLLVLSFVVGGFGLTTLQTRSSTPTGLGGFAPESIVPLEGSLPFATILCQFPGTGSPPNTTGFFDEMMGDDQPGLGHYWSTVSHDAIDLDGSTVFGWYELPSPLADYETETADRTGDCLAAANADIDFDGFWGINLVFSHPSGGASGGRVEFPLDGPAREFGVTWIEPDTSGDFHQATFAHEMGHAFGFPHSSGPGEDPPDSWWDVMSNPADLCVIYTGHNDPTLGCVATPPLAYLSHLFGWIGDTRVITLVPGAPPRTVELQCVVHDGLDANLILVPRGDGRFYTIEVRCSDYRYQDYIGFVGNKHAFIHDLDPSRMVAGDPRPLVVISSTGVTNSSTGVRWTVGEEFEATDIPFTMDVLEHVGDGLRLRLTLDDLPTDTTPTVTVAPSTTPGPTPDYQYRSFAPNAAKD
ncbi:MAG TPA: hypothetical protein VFK32_07675 [Tepidiformaceae bacterium]|nr:hypothetical protein [Tepidiformaceae bacterium]